MSEFEVKPDRLKISVDKESQISKRINNLSKNIRSVAARIQLDAKSERAVRQNLDLKEILLKKGYQVVMLREDEQSKLSPVNRSIAAAESGADIFVIVSSRKRQDIGVRGAMGYVQTKTNPNVGYMYEECYRLTECILNQYCATGLFDNNGIYENDEIKGINWSKIPVTNILLGCISDVSDEQKLADQSNWEMMAEGIANGIDEYFSMQ